MEDYVCACKEPKDRVVNRQRWQELIIASIVVSVIILALNFQVQKPKIMYFHSVEGK